MKIPLTTATWDAVTQPGSHTLDVLAIGALRVDLPDDQPPFVGLILELDHHTERIGGSFMMLYRISDVVADELIEALTIVRRGDREPG